MVSCKVPFFIMRKQNKTNKQKKKTISYGSPGVSEEGSQHHKICDLWSLQEKVIFQSIELVIEISHQSLPRSNYLSCAIQMIFYSFVGPFSLCHQLSHVCLLLGHFKHLKLSLNVKYTDVFWSMKEHHRAITLSSDANTDQNNPWQEQDMRHERCLIFTFLQNN